MQRILLIFLLYLSAAHAAMADNVTLLGAGATFPYPIYAKWAQTYQTQTGIRLNYQAIGSGGGIKQIEAKTVDFGASDLPLQSTDLAKNHLVQFPAIVGGVVPIINIPDIKTGELKLTGAILSQIYLGKIKKWNDPIIKTINPNLNLPDIAITIVHRSDGSGTTFLFTHYLSKVSEDWNKKIGADSAISWPTGIGGKGNQGVAAYVQRIKGSIGYVEFAYAQQEKFSMVQLQNQNGNFVSPSVDSFKAATVNAKWQASNDFAEILTNQAGAQSWPITGASFILMQAVQDKPTQGKAVLQFFDWAYKNGKDTALALEYVPLPNNIVSLIEKHWKEKMKDGAGKPIW